MSDAAGRADALHVVWVNQYAVPPDQPGGTRHFDMASALREEGIEAEVVASDLNLVTRRYSRRTGASDLRAHHELVQGVRFTWLTAGSYSANDWRRVASMLVFACRATLHLLFGHRPKRCIYVGSSPHLFAALGTWAAARLRRRPFVAEIRDLWPESYEAVSGRSGGSIVRVMRVMADLLYRRSDAVVVFAPANRDHVIARGAASTSVAVIPNGVDLSAFAAPGEPAADLGHVGRFTFVYAGAHGPANGLDVVVDACADLARRGDQRVHVVLMGDGPEKLALERRVAAAGLTNLTFHAAVPKSAVPATLRTADAGLMVLAPVDLFAHGVSPNKLFDYLACDLPVVTNVPGLVAQIVTDSGAGVVAAPGDAVALADAMSSVAGAPPLGASGAAYVAQHYDRRVLAARFAALLLAVSSGEEPAQLG